MTRWLIGFCAGMVLLTACGSSLPAPAIRAISPSQIDQGDAPLIRLQADAVYPFAVDYGERRTDVNTDVVVRIGGLPLQATTLNTDGSITGVAPFGLPPGAQDVELQLADGRTALLPGGLVVRPAYFPDSYLIDPIPDQKRNTPFEITVHAVGDQASLFKGVVRLDASRGGIDPTVSAPFEAGVLKQQVSLSAQFNQMVLTVQDALGHTGRSNPFRVSN